MSARWRRCHFGEALFVGTCAVLLFIGLAVVAGLVGLAVYLLFPWDLLVLPAVAFCWLVGWVALRVG